MPGTVPIMGLAFTKHNIRLKRAIVSFEATIAVAHLALPKKSAAGLASRWPSHKYILL